MGCLDPVAPVVPLITRGSAIVIPFQLPVDQFTGIPVDLTSASEIKFALLNADGTILQKLKSTSAITDNGYKIGSFNVAVTEAETLLLKLSAAGLTGDLGARVEYVIGARTYIWNQPGYCTVVDNIFPGL